MFGPVASDPTVSRLINSLASAGPKALAAIRSAQAEVRERVWKSAGPSAPDEAGQVIVDLGGVLVLAHSDTQDAAATWKKTYGHHPLMVTSTTEGRDRGAGDGSAAARERGQQHCRRPHHHHPTDPGPAAETPPARRNTLIVALELGERLPESADVPGEGKQHDQAGHLAGDVQTQGAAEDWAQRMPLGV